MNTRFDFAIPRGIRFGSGRAEELPALAAGLGRRALFVTGAHPERHAALAQGLCRSGVVLTPFMVVGEPTTDSVRAGVAAARDADCDLVISLGGGSVLDTGKAVAALLANPGDLFDYLEIVGRARPLDLPATPHVAVPTTAGSGAEVTRNAVLRAPAHGVKVSLRSPGLLPTVVLVDPRLTLGLPPFLTALTGLDALTQLVEGFVSLKANPLTDGLCREGLARAARSLARAVTQGDELPAREDMALASLLSGLVLANAGLGAVHGLAAPLGGMLDAPHGAVCAALLAPVMAMNLARLKRQTPAAAALARYAEAAAILTGGARSGPEDGLEWVRALIDPLHLPGLEAWGLTEDQLEEVAARAQRASSMQGNPVALSPGDLIRILRAAL